VELLGFVRVWLIVAPEPLLMPVIPPILAPIVHAKLDAALAVKEMPGPVPLQVDALAEVVTTGAGFTVTVIVIGITDTAASRRCRRNYILH
jgi:hypothetical protein